MAMLQRLGDLALCPLQEGRVRIGRDIDNEIVVEDEFVSVHHAVIEVEESEGEDALKEYTIADTDSTNRTFVNNKEIKRQRLYDGDVIRVGRTRLKFSTKEYTPPQSYFEETRQLNGRILSNFLFKKVS